MDNILIHTPLGYFKYFYRWMGKKLIFNIFLAVLLGLMDGLGLALFIPLLAFVNESSTSTPASDSMGNLSFIVDVFSWVGLPLNLISVLSLMVIIFVIKGLLNYRLSMEQIDLRQRYMVKLRLGQIHDLERLGYQGFLKLDAGQIQNSLTSEVGKNLQAMIQFLATTKSAIVLISYIVLAFLANWSFALFIIIGGYLSNFLYSKILKSVKSASIDISKRGSIFSSYIIQSIHNFKYLKATSYFSRYSVMLKKVINEVEGLNRRIGKSQALTSSSREPIIILIVAIVILVQTQYFDASLGSVLLSLLLFYRALNGLVLVQTSWQSFMQNVGALQSVSDLRTLMIKNYEKQESLPITAYKNNIEIKGLNFAYGNKLVLKDINITINKNETIAFVGESGSGKSTLANLLITLLHPQSGDILIDGVSLFSYNLNTFRSKIGYIAQEPIIFTDTIYNNVTFWADKTEENLKRFWDVIGKVALLPYMAGLDKKEDTLLGDNGMLISGGQKQRISIARELFKDIEILIMDEATSALDSETENFIQDSINALHGKYTMVIIAHRLSTIKNADKIYLLEEGKVSSEGNFNALISNSATFSRMVSLQNMH
jgi:ABC-type multidrug transport system fused ATPase/permease subunit